MPTSLNQTLKVIALSFLSLSCLPPGKGPVENLENEITLKRFENSEDFAGALFCYYVFQNVVDPSQITPQLFAKFVKGGSLSLRRANDYEKWLTSQNGTLCKQIVGVDFTPLANPAGRQYGIFLNLPAIREEGKDPKLTYRHELLHVAFDKHKKSWAKIERKWNSLSFKEQEHFIERHPGYNFKDSKTLLKEYFSYSFQDNIQHGLKLIQTD